MTELLLSGVVLITLAGVLGAVAFATLHGSERRGLGWLLTWTSVSFAVIGFALLALFWWRAKS